MAEPGVARAQRLGQVASSLVQSKEMANLPGAAFVLEPRPTNVERAS
jgi:hypothetical protein